MSVDKDQSMIGIKGTTAVYDAETDEYEIDLQNVHLISTDSRTKVIRIKIKSDQINKRTLETISITPNTNGAIFNPTDNKEIDEINEQNINTNEQTTNEQSEHIEENKEDVLPLTKQYMKQWFTNTIRLPQYFELFIEEGYEDLSYLDEEITDNDLIEIGINKKPHRRKILKEIQKLILNPPNVDINNNNNIISQQVTDTIPIEPISNNITEEAVITRDINENEDEKLQEQQVNEQPIEEHVSNAMDKDIKEGNDEIDAEIVDNESGKINENNNEIGNEINDECNEITNNENDKIEENNEIEKVIEVQAQEQIVEEKDEINSNEMEQIQEQQMSEPQMENDGVEHEVIDNINDNNTQIDSIQQTMDINNEVIQAEEPIKEEIVSDNKALNEVISNEINEHVVSEEENNNNNAIIEQVKEKDNEPMVKEVTPKEDSIEVIEHVEHENMENMNDKPLDNAQETDDIHQKDIVEINEKIIENNEQKLDETQQHKLDEIIENKSETEPIIPDTKIENEKNNNESENNNESINDIDDNKEEIKEEIKESEDEEVVNIDMAMTEMIEKSANQKSIERMNSSDINDDKSPMNDRLKGSNVSSDTGSVSTAMSSNEFQFKVDWRISFIPHNIKKEWIKIMPKSNDNSNQHFTCGNDIYNCPCLNRLIFVLNNYMLYIKYKISSSIKKKKYMKRDYPKSMTAFFNLLINYNKVRLMNDYFHIKRYHLKHNMTAFFEYFKSKLVTVKCMSLRQSNKVCLMWNRNQGQKELYRLYSSAKRRNIYFITSDSNIKEMSNSEMNEINLQQFLDMIHSSFIHKSISNGNKFTNRVYILGNDKNKNKSTTDDEKGDDNNIVDVPNYTFGVLFDYYDSNKSNYIRNKYGNLKKELLNNIWYKMDKNDYNMLWFKSKDFILSNEGRYCISKRIKGKINKIGKEITMDIIMSLIIYCNYNEITNKLKRGCRRVKWKENMDALKIKHSEVVNWCKYILEGVYCFGNALEDNKYLYHNINCKLAFNLLQIQFNVPTSTTNKYIIAKCLNQNNTKGICLKLSNSSSSDLHLNISNISDFPNEEECIVYGNRFNINDIIINKISYFQQLNVLKLYYQIIRGRWYTQNKNQFKKKNQRQIIKFINNMINNENKTDYIQMIFESMNKNLRKNIIWVNRNGMEQLLPELKQLFFSEFLDYLKKNYNIKTEYSNVIVLKINKDEINKSSRDKAIYSCEYKHPVKIVNNKNISDLLFSFRCYQKYDPLNKDMVLKGEFVIKPFSNRIESIRISGGMWFPQISFDKWDFCTFTHKKLTKGSSLFSIKKLDKINNELIVKICFQIKEINPSRIQ